MLALRCDDSRLLISTNCCDWYLITGLTRTCYLIVHEVPPICHVYMSAVISRAVIPTWLWSRRAKRWMRLSQSARGGQHDRKGFSFDSQGPQRPQVQPHPQPHQQHSTASGSLTLTSARPVAPYSKPESSDRAVDGPLKVRAAPQIRCTTASVLHYIATEAPL